MKRKQSKKIAYGFLCLLLACVMAIPSFATEHIDNQISQQEEEIQHVRGLFTSGTL